MANNVDQPIDDDYVSNQNDGPIPVTSDNTKIDSGVNATNQDSDEMLARDDKDAIDSSNIIDERTRGAAPAKGTYTEPGDEEGLGDGNDGRSRVAGGPNPS